MARRERSSPSLDVLSEWVRVDPVSGEIADRAALGDPGAASLRDADGAVRLAGARNEYVSFQVIVRNGGRRIRDVWPRFGGLAGPHGARIGRSEFEPHVQWYHHVEPHGWLPDALMKSPNGARQNRAATRKCIHCSGLQRRKKFPRIALSRSVVAP